VRLDSAKADRGTLLRPSTAPPVLDPNTGTYTTPAPTTLWAGPCWVGQFVTGSAQDIGGQQVTLANLVVKVPKTVTDVKPGDQFKVTATADSRLLNRPLTVLSVGGSSAGVWRELLAHDDQG
jgi:hypothetical protein